MCVDEASKGFHKLCHIKLASALHVHNIVSKYLLGAEQYIRSYMCDIVNLQILAIKYVPGYTCA